MESGIKEKPLSLNQGEFVNVLTELKARISESGGYYVHDAQNGVYLFRLKSIGMTERHWREKLFSSLFYASECLSSILSDDFRPKFNKVYDVIVFEKDSVFSGKKSAKALFELASPSNIGVVPKEAIILLLHFLALQENHGIELPFISIVKGVLKDSSICHEILVANFEKLSESKSIAFNLPSGLNSKNWNNYGNLALCIAD